MAAAAIYKSEIYTVSGADGIYEVIEIKPAKILLHRVDVIEIEIPLSEVHDALTPAAETPTPV